MTEQTHQVRTFTEWAYAIASAGAELWARCDVLIGAIYVSPARYWELIGVADLTPADGRVFDIPIVVSTGFSTDFVAVGPLVTRHDGNRETRRAHAKQLGLHPAVRWTSEAHGRQVEDEALTWEGMFELVEFR